MDWSSTPNPEGIAPYGRDHNYCTTGSCVDAESNFECGGTDQIKCWTMGFDGAGATPGAALTGVMECTGGAMVSQILQNCYASDGVTMLEFPSECSFGWKAVAASVNWLGITGFLDDASCCNDGGQSQTRYKAVSSNESGSYSSYTSRTSRCDGSTETPNLADSLITSTLTQSINLTARVDFGGNVTRTAAIHSNQATEVDGDHSNWLDSCNIDDLTGAAGGLSSGGVYPTGAAPLPSGSFPLTASCGIITAGYPTGHPSNSLFPEVQGTAAELNALGLFGAATDPGGTPGQTITSSATPCVFVLTDDELSVSWSQSTTRTKVRLGTCAAYPGDYAETEIVTTGFSKVIKLTLPETFAQTVERAEALLAEWPLNDDRILPWRTDADLWLVPLLTFDAVNNAPDLQYPTCVGERTTTWGEFVDCMTCEVAQTTGGTGEIIGAPLPPGYGYHFNYWHKNYIDCNAGIDCGECIETYGMMGVSPLSPCATQWTTKLQGWEMYGKGAHISQRGGVEIQPYAGVLVQKWAETLEAWPSQNYSRPCGRDRYLFDESSVGCQVTNTLPVLQLEPEDPQTEFEVGDIVVLSEGGIYEILTKTDALNYTVSDKLYDSPILCDGASKLRFPTARAICSTLAATAVQTSPGLITVTCVDKHWLLGGGTENDTVTFTGIGGITSEEATATSDTDFTVAGTLTTSPSTGTISHGATAEQIAFDRTCPRHDLIYREWQSNFRAMNEDGDPAAPPTETPLTIAPSSSHPTVLCISPNGETFPNGVTYGFGTIAADMCWGEEWHADFLQAVQDPFWQADHKPCGWGGAWTQAALPCATLDVDEYAFPPLVEPRITVPTGAPTFEATVTLHTPEGMPGAINHPNCDVNPYGEANVHYWREAWLTCEDWKELLRYKCG